MAKFSFESSSISSKFPSASPKSVNQWLQRKKLDDNAEGLWRVHDKLYDLINFIQRHPGGADWLQLTQGTDITELFETHHIGDKAEMLLHSFYVRDAKEPRNSRITFCEDGFYKSLKNKVADNMKLANQSKLDASKVSTSEGNQSKPQVTLIFTSRESQMPSWSGRFSRPSVQSASTAFFYLSSQG
jgi:cytochrome b involved in lipid metabolism